MEHRFLPALHLVPRHFRVITKRLVHPMHLKINQASCANPEWRHNPRTEAKERAAKLLLFLQNQKKDNLPPIQTIANSLEVSMKTAYNTLYSLRLRGLVALSA